MDFDVIEQTLTWFQLEIQMATCKRNMPFPLDGRLFMATVA
jgi:hypothetical protein